MANIKSAMKRAKVSSVENLRNRMVKSSVKTALKRFDTALNNGDLETAKALYSATVSKGDKAAAKGVYHKNNAGHKKALLARRLARAEAAQ